MRKLERLRREALKQATAKGHVMRRFWTIKAMGGWPVKLSCCCHCGKVVNVSPYSMHGVTLTKKCRPTIAYIAERNAAAGGYYFSRDTLRFFGQRRSDFKIHVRAGRVFVQASSYQGGNYMGESFAEFNPKTGEVVSIGICDAVSVADFLAGLED